MDSTARFLAIVALAAFATERILAVVNYLIDAVGLMREESEAAAERRAKEGRRLLLLTIAAVIGYVIVQRAQLRLLGVLKVDKVNDVVDFWLTWLAVVAGADRVRAMLGGGDAKEKGNTSIEDSDAPIIRVQIDNGEVRDLHRVR